jgi:hypothetical protein
MTSGDLTSLEHCRARINIDPVAAVFFLTAIAARAASDGALFTRPKHALPLSTESHLVVCVG